MLVVVFLTWIVSRWDARAAYRLFEHTEHVFFEPEPVEGAAVLGAKVARATDAEERAQRRGRQEAHLSPLVKKGWPQNNSGGAVVVMCDWTRLARSTIPDPSQTFQTRSLCARIRKRTGPRCFVHDFREHRAHARSATQAVVPLALLSGFVPRCLRPPFSLGYTRTE